MHSMVTTVKNTLLYIWKLLKEYILKVLIIRKKCTYVWSQMLTKLFVVITLQYIHISIIVLYTLK